jgi:CelD/BcsL family acetyltransferase involved in cellulose biosynthesis
MQVEVISDYSLFEALKQEWNELADNFPSPLLRHEWTDACLRTLYPRNARPNVVVARSNGRLRAVAPLISVRQAGLRQLVMPGGNILHEPCGFLYDSEAALLEISQVIFKMRASLALPRFDVRSKAAEVLQERSANAIRFNRSGASSLRVPLKGTWAEFEASLSSGRRSHLRGYRRRAERLGKVEFEAISPEAGALGPHLEDLFRLEASGWKGRAGSAALSNPHIHRFYCEYAEAAARIGMLRLFFLKIDGKRIAARMAVVNGGRLWELKIGYDEAWSNCMPGILLTHETLRWAVESGLEAHEFLGQAEQWERHWPTEEDEYVSMRIYPLAPAGQLSLVRDVGQIALKSAPKLVQEHLSGAARKALDRGAGAYSSLLAVSKAMVRRPNLSS